MGSEKSGGAEVLMMQTVKLLRERGVEVDVFTSHHVKDRKVTPLRYINHNQCRASLRHKLREFQPDVAHVHNLYHALSPGILAELAACKKVRPLRVVLTAHDYHLACPNSGAMWYSSNNAVNLADRTRLRSLAYLLSRRWDRRGWAHSLLKLLQHVWNYRICNRRSAIDIVVSPSQFMHDIMHAAGVNSIHLPYPSPLVSKSILGQRSDQLTLLFAGRVEPEKGVAEFLECLPNEWPFDFIIVGNGSELERCQRVCNRRRIAERVTFTGRLSHDETLRAISQSHVLVLPSLWWENYPLSLLEALAMGTNILVSDCGGMREVVQVAGTGFKFVPSNQASLRDAIVGIHHQFAQGTLNSFTLSNELSQRDESWYIGKLMNLYRCDETDSTAFCQAAKQPAAGVIR